MPIVSEMYEDAGDFMGLRQDFRKRNLERVRREFGLPVPEIIEDRAIYKDTEGVEHPWHQSRRSEPGIAEVQEFWGELSGEVSGNPMELTEVPVHRRRGMRDRRFPVLSTSDDGVPIDRELRDLDRDIEGLMKAETVDHGVHPNPGFVLDSLDDDAVDLRLQKWIKAHE